MNAENMSISAVAKAARRTYMKEYRKTMTEEQKQKRRDYQRQWREENRDRTRMHQETYWIKKAAELQAK